MYVHEFSVLLRISQIHFFIIFTQLHSYTHFTLFFSHLNYVCTFIKTVWENVTVR